MKLIVVSKKLAEFSSPDLIIELQKEIGNEYSYLLIEPKDKSYKVEEIKEFIRKTSLKKDTNTSKIVSVITKGDSLTLIVQNALLKTLEDSNVDVIILVKNPNSLLPTIKSRMQIEELKIENLESRTKEAQIDFDSISSIAKLERSEVIKKLESLIENIDSSEVKKVVLYQDAIDKINANCKVEAVLVELLSKS